MVAEGQATAIARHPFGSARKFVLRARGVQQDEARLDRDKVPEIRRAADIEDASRPRDPGFTDELRHAPPAKIKRDTRELHRTESGKTSKFHSRTMARVYLRETYRRR